jgi:uncharacterized protein (DUF885 family)
MLVMLPIGIACSACSDSPAAEAAGDRLAALCHDYWEGALHASPTAATALGDRRFDDRLEDLTAAGRAAERARLEALRAQVEAVNPQAISDTERVSRAALIEVIESDLIVLDCDFHSWVVDAMGGPPVNLFNIPSYQTVQSAADARAMTARWRAMGPYLDAHIANLESGIASGRVAALHPTRRVSEQLAELLAKPTSEWALLQPLAKEYPELPDADRKRFPDELGAAVEESVKPALERYRRLLETEVLPRARPEEKAGLCHLPRGAECYQKMIRMHTSLDLPPDRIHQIGLDEVARIHNEMCEIGARALATGKIAEIFERLRSDRGLYFGSREEVETKAREAVARAQAATPEWFGTLPRTPCDVVRMKEHEEKHAPIAYYRPPAADGSRPGQYYINTFAPETRTRYGAESLAFHEAVPGHHFQIAIAQELTGLPEFRKHTGITAYFEGWALYAEELADEGGLYSGDLDRLGKLSEESWRACRLVVDTGIHALGWSRTRAIEFMSDNTAAPGNVITSEIDRYITWPGQALAYKLGMLEIQKLRAEGERRLGSRFDIRAFHDSLLGNGAVGLGILRQLVEAHYETVEAGG